MNRVIEKKPPIIRINGVEIKEVKGLYLRQSLYHGTNGPYEFEIDLNIDACNILYRIGEKRFIVNIVDLFKKAVEVLEKEGVISAKAK